MAKEDKLKALDAAISQIEKQYEIGICELTSQDVVRHPVVQKIVKAYEDYESRSRRTSDSRKKKQETRTR